MFFFPLCSLPISSSLPLGLKSTTLSTSPYGGNYVTWRSCLQGPFIQNCFLLPFDFHFGRFCGWSRNIFRRSEVKLKCKFILLRLKNSGACVVRTWVPLKQKFPMGMLSLWASRPRPISHLSECKFYRWHKSSTYMTVLSSKLAKT